MPKPASLLTQPFDVVIVLGNPANVDGSPGVLMASRVEKAVQIVKSGQADRLLMTGGGVYNSFVEAEVMASYAHQLGVPESEIFVENQARDTYQNARLATQLCRQKGWQRVIVVTNRFHLARARRIFRKESLQCTFVGAETPAALPWYLKLAYYSWEWLLDIKLAVFSDKRLVKS
ncbi:YdcF family protein [Spirosoma utsteinense]|uniref:SAM-binding protein YcdF (DUF218 family) n=1 Tax=Spirosoma utsteinense TaxID=2585773 RepID=A0ABR6W8A7_9BACT|nr:YdcF family protein [Spirosoma utsteinense]MBC3784094.1 putative SAM-binding protein YcdF (DUF218 family) [Spirosoma utsteinense]MBC3792817.1 putative SAM-binding protein YcdF (DUF218 family) [Spirosoma utsteinense]